MPSAFVSLRDWLTPEPSLPVEEIVAEEASFAESDEESIAERVPDDASELLRDIRLFRARLGDALDRQVVTLLREIAVEVLARELELAPADLDGVVERARERYVLFEPFVVRAHPADVATLSKDMRVVADSTLRTGDVVLEVPGGVVDASLGMRLDRLLRGFER